MNTQAFDALRGYLTGLYAFTLSEELSEKPKKPDELLAALEGLPQNITLKLKLTQFSEDFADIFKESTDWLGWLTEFDNLFVKHPAFKIHKEYFFDIFFVHALSLQEEEGEDFMESPEWLKVEAKLENRGTELLNILMYLREVQESELRANLDDFLNEFVLDDEFDYQDDAEVYEEVISNKNWIELTYSEMVRNCESLEDETAIPEIFTPLFCFFKSPEKTSINLMACILAGGKAERNTSVSALLHAWYHGISTFPKSLMVGN